MHTLSYLEGKRFCVVFVKVLDAESGRVQCRCMRGRASIEGGQVKLCGGAGAYFTVPSTALPTIAPNDGTALLKDAEYYCLVRVSENIDIGHGPDDDDGGECDCGCSHHDHGECDHGPVVY